VVIEADYPPEGRRIRATIAGLVAVMLAGTLLARARRPPTIGSGPPGTGR